MTLAQDYAGLVAGNILEFIEIDCSDVTDGDISFFRFFNGFNQNDPNGQIEFLGATWSPMPFTSEGWIRDSSGGTQRPTLTFADFNGLFLSAAVQHGELIGAKVRRWETNSANRASDAYGPELFILNQIVEANGEYVKVVLANPLDARSRKIPGVVMRKDRFPALGSNRV